MAYQQIIGCVTAACRCRLLRRSHRRSVLKKSPGRALHAGSPWTLPAARRPDGLLHLRVPFARPEPDSLPVEARLFTGVRPVPLPGRPEPLYLVSAGSCERGGTRALVRSSLLCPAAIAKSDARRCA